MLAFAVQITPDPAVGTFMATAGSGSHMLRI
jgi:hypothetical protein